MPKPHGNILINRYITKNNIDIQDLPKIEINTNLAEDIINIATGVFSPLTGFLTYNDLHNVIHHKRLNNDIPWTIPILFDKPKNSDIKEGDTIMLVNNDTGLQAILDVNDIYTLPPSRPTCGDAENPWPVGDLNRDCSVDFLDLEILTSQWLNECDWLNWNCSGADLNFDGNVDNIDYSQLLINVEWNIKDISNQI